MQLFKKMLFVFITLINIFLGFGISWRWVVSFTLRRLYSRKDSHRYPSDRKLGEPQSRHRREKNFWQFRISISDP
jgi:hypothetical protein